jgi:hypothetical protein
MATEYTLMDVLRPTLYTSVRYPEGSLNGLDEVTYFVYTGSPFEYSVN